ncbi:MAG: antibiotic biosynthesis monooxygenase [Planctomycetota bacterium]
MGVLTVAAVVARDVEPRSVHDYERWLTGIGEAQAAFEGSLGTTVLRPAGESGSYLAVLQFSDRAHLDAWLESEERRSWLARLDRLGTTETLFVPLAGLEYLGAPPSSAPEAGPPRWKTGVMVLTGLYPIVALLGVVLDPLLEPLPEPLALLASLAVSVSLMVWVVLPALGRLLTPWLHGTSE